MPPPQSAQPSYLDGLLQAYEAEIAGEAYFKALTGVFSEARHQDKLMLLAEVEQRTWKILHPLVIRHELKPGDGAKLAVRGVILAEESAFRRWRDLLQNMTTRYPGFIENFKRLEAAGPDEDKNALRALVEHEIALLAFAERETRGQTNSLSPVRQYLKCA